MMKEVIIGLEDGILIPKHGVPYSNSIQCYTEVRLRLLYD
jgi:hypothetical protein